jgi:hypothetical protein
MTSISLVLAWLPQSGYPFSLWTWRELFFASSTSTQIRCATSPPARGERRSWQSRRQPLSSSASTSAPQFSSSMLLKSSPRRTLRSWSSSRTSPRTGRTREACEWSSCRATGACSSSSRAGRRSRGCSKPPFEVGDISDKEAVEFLTRKGVEEKQAEEAVRDITGGRFELLNEVRG